MTAEEAAQHPGRHTLRDAVMGHPLTPDRRGHVGRSRQATDCCCAATVCRRSIDEAIARAANRSARGVIDAVLAVGTPQQDNVTIIKLEQEV